MSVLPLVKPFYLKKSVLVINNDIRIVEKRTDESASGNAALI